MGTNIDTLQDKYQKAFTTYINAIQHLLQQYSIRQLTAQFPHMDMNHVRMASETRYMPVTGSISIFILNEVRGMPRPQQEEWINRAQKQCLDPLTLRKLIRTQSTRPPSQTGNRILKSAWLLRRKLNQCTQAERTRLESILNASNKDI